MFTIMNTNDVEANYLKVIVELKSWYVFNWDSKTTSLLVKLKSRFLTFQWPKVADRTYQTGSNYCQQQIYEKINH